MKLRSEVGLEEEGGGGGWWARLGAKGSVEARPALLCSACRALL